MKQAKSDPKQIDRLLPPAFQAIVDELRAIRQLLEKQQQNAKQDKTRLPQAVLS